MTPEQINEMAKIDEVIDDFCEYTHRQRSEVVKVLTDGWTRLEQSKTDFPTYARLKMSTMLIDQELDDEKLKRLLR